MLEPTVPEGRKKTSPDRRFTGGNVAFFYIGGLPLVEGGDSAGPENTAIGIVPSFEEGRCAARRGGLLSSLLCGLSLLATMVNPLQAANISGKVTVPRAANNQDVVIYIDKIPGKVFPPPAKPEILDQLNLRFVPHVLPILAGTTVQFPNSDLVRHNVFSPGPAQKFNLGTYPVGKSAIRVFKDPGVVTLLCNIHAEMSGYIVVTETPYYATSDSRGNFTIPNVPPGRYVLKVWHEKYPKVPPREITVSAEDLKDINIDLSKK